MLDNPLDAPVKLRTTETRPLATPTIWIKQRMKVLFAVGSWGLGHATRDLPLINRLLESGCELTVVSTDRALSLLRKELGPRCEFFDWPDVPKPLARTAKLFYTKFALSVPLVFRTILSEHRTLQNLLRRRRFDRIISDNRFGIHSRRIDSYQIAHGLRAIAPRRNRQLELALEYFCYSWLRPARRVIVPDYLHDGLSGDLSHNLTFFEPERLEYIGILASVRRRPVEPDVDLFVTISGPEPQRAILEEIVLGQVDALPGKVVVALGKPEEPLRTWQHDGAQVYSYLDRRQQENLMNRSRLIVSRSGYTTLMELVELNRQALLIPTPGQTEQEYLGWLHNSRGTYLSVTQQRLDLRRDVERAGSFRGYEAPHLTDESVERFVRLISS